MDRDADARPEVPGGPGADTPDAPRAGLRPMVGVGVLVLCDGRLLLGRRRTSHGRRTWQPPGGHLEFGETVEDCARREVKEEADISIRDLRIGPYTNDVFADEGKHYISLFIVATLDSGEPRRTEPDKTERWDWFRWTDMPEPLFLPLEHLRASGYDPFADQSLS